jgi:hypothetical protein
MDFDRATASHEWRELLDGAVAMVGAAAHRFTRQAVIGSRTR